METLERLTRRQVDALQAVRAGQTPERGASLNGIAGRLRLRPPTALGHLTQLEELGLIERYRGKSRLTERGRRTIVEYDRHHRIAEGLFDQLGLSAEDTCRAAREVDLSLSHKTVERLCEAEGHPARCPHGEAIPPCEDEPERA